MPASLHLRVSRASACCWLLLASLTETPNWRSLSRVCGILSIGFLLELSGFVAGLEHRQGVFQPLGHLLHQLHVDGSSMGVTGLVQRLGEVPQHDGGGVGAVFVQKLVKVHCPVPRKWGWLLP